MPFRCRNSFYLRISESNVLPFYLYLDDRHLDWMSDRILQHVIADLRPHVVDKLKAEANIQTAAGPSSSSNRSTVDTHRGDTYQFCYFLRKAEPHSVLLKTRHFVAAPPRPSVATAPEVPSVSESPKKRGKRKAVVKAESPEEASVFSKKRRVKRTQSAADGNVEMVADLEPVVTDHDTGLRRSGRTRNLPVRTYAEHADQEDVMDVDSPTRDTLAGDSDNEEAFHPSLNESGEEEGGDGDDANEESRSDKPKPSGQTSRHEIDLTVEEEEEKPKPILQLKYKGFNIFGHSLCVVVEPWPSIQYSVTARKTSIAPIFTQATEKAPVRFKTPLFLPEDDREGSVIADIGGPRPFPMINDIPSDDDDDEYGGMVQFSQLLNTMGDRAGAADDNEEIMADVFTNDADEARGSDLG
ncbi:hypothetical protein HGRIS_009490 [Hohenbuehelia grisea]|uniref:Uncharacterized protein n=1 Tax=Hohenbuehelia grisea TaxID=104357 RepID=A0ABR3J1B1_9AGAR